MISVLLNLFVVIPIKFIMCIFEFIFGLIISFFKIIFGVKYDFSKSSKNVKISNIKKEDNRSFIEKYDDMESKIYGLSKEEREYCRKNNIPPRDYVKDEDDFIG